MIEVKTMSSLADEIVKETHNKILLQLNDFISRGLISVEVREPIFVRSYDSNTIEYKQEVTLVLKDKQYIERLERENKYLRETIDAIGKPKG